MRILLALPLLFAPAVALGFTPLAGAMEFSFIGLLPALVALLYGRSGETGQTVLRYAGRPQVRVLSGDMTSSYDAATGDLRLDYPHAGLARVRLLLSDGSGPLFSSRAREDLSAAVARALAGLEVAGPG